MNWLALLGIFTGAAIVVASYWTGYCRGYKQSVDDFEFYDRKPTTPDWRNIK